MAESVAIIRKGERPSSRIRRRFFVVAAETQAHLGGFSDEKEYGEEGGKRLGNDGGDRRARDAHMKAVDKKRVQRDIGDGADADGEHSRLAVSLTDDIGVQSRREDGEKRCPAAYQVRYSDA